MLSVVAAARRYGLLLLRARGDVRRLRRSSRGRDLKGPEPRSTPLAQRGIVTPESFTPNLDQTR